MAVILDGASGVTHNLESEPMSVFFINLCQVRINWLKEKIYRKLRKKS